jgi:hypothetical protein
MNWLFNICLFVSLVGDSRVLQSPSVSQDGHTEEGHQSQGKDSHLATTGVPLTWAEAEKPQSLDLSSIEGLNAQAINYQNKGQYRQAEPLFLEALTLCEKYGSPTSH